jgi:hypothetical protein
MQLSRFNIVHISRPWRLAVAPLMASNLALDVFSASPSDDFIRRCYSNTWCRVSLSMTAWIDQLARAEHSSNQEQRSYSYCRQSPLSRGGHVERLLYLERLSRPPRRDYNWVSNQWINQTYQRLDSNKTTRLWFWCTSRPSATSSISAPFFVWLCVLRVVWIWWPTGW